MKQLSVGDLCDAKYIQNVFQNIIFALKKIFLNCRKKDFHNLNTT
jgi:hypothetical protein